MPRRTAKELKQLGIGRRVRDLREAKGMSVDDLAQQLSVSKVLLAQIEEDVVPPTVATLLNISKLLGVKIDHFFTDTESSGRIEITRSDERVAVYHDALPDGEQARLNYNYESLSYRLARKKMEPFFVEIDADPTDSAQLSHDGEEFMYVLSGEIDLHFGDEHFRLVPGDSAYFVATVPHQLRGVGGKKAEAIIVLYPYAN